MRWRRRRPILPQLCGAAMITALGEAGAPAESQDGVDLGVAVMEALQGRRYGYMRSWWEANHGTAAGDLAYRTGLDEDSSHWLCAAAMVAHAALGRAVTVGSVVELALEASEFLPTA